MARRLLVILLLGALAIGVVWVWANGGLPAVTPTTPAVVAPSVDESAGESGAESVGESVVEPEAPAPDAAATGIPAAATAAVVEYVHDGDTLFLEDGRKVRLLGINTPEIGDNAECYGNQARDELREWLPEGQAVWVLEDVEPLDQYGRSLLFVFLDDGTNVNLELITVGVAEVEQYSPNWLYSDELRSAEASAYEQGLGMWGVCGYAP
jgi:micrococcal nuclease